MPSYQRDKEPLYESMEEVGYHSKEEPLHHKQRPHQTRHQDLYDADCGVIGIAQPISPKMQLISVISAASTRALYTYSLCSIEQSKNYLDVSFFDHYYYKK